jgi:predicted RNA-binding protein with PUA-like domain
MKMPRVDELRSHPLECAPVVRMKVAKRYWLMKSEPDVFSIDDLNRDRNTWWEGVRNYQARNFMLHDMNVGDEVLFYHSNAEPSGIAGTAVVTKAATPDPTQFDKKSEYHDPKSTPENPRWQCVQIGQAKKFPKFISLDELRANAALKNMMVLKKGQRLSVQPVTPEEFALVKKMGHK